MKALKPYFVLIAVILCGFFGPDLIQAQGGTIPQQGTMVSPLPSPMPEKKSEISVEFKDTPNFDGWTHMSGTMTMTLRLAENDTLEDFSSMFILSDGTNGYVGEMNWEKVGGEYQWVQYIPASIFQMNFLTDQEIHWEIQHPWWGVSPSGQGIQKKARKYKEVNLPVISR